MDNGRYYALSFVAQRRKGKKLQMGLHGAVIRIEPDTDLDAFVNETMLDAFPIDDGWGDHFSARLYPISQAIINLEKASQTPAPLGVSDEGAAWAAEAAR
jgi:hypothetical protein